MRTSMMVMMSSKCVWRALVVMQLLVCSTIALKCKCTQSSGTVKCVDGVCEISTHPAGSFMGRYKSAEVDIVADDGLFAL
ncbi:hypothetical protein Tcan_01852 [Toxocara canis]|uniref:Secreted protein n=1 Tax=Toxocara canis TaxID=6265 RepID=A0A0B2V7V6_TOXCA|nr:hypothetical protein Tcan_01852 [Toxocara canis]